MDLAGNSEGAVSRAVSSFDSNGVRLVLSKVDDLLEIRVEAFAPAFARHPVTGLWAYSTSVDDYMSGRARRTGMPGVPLRWSSMRQFTRSRESMRTPPTQRST